MPTCEECGSHSVERLQLEGVWVEECGLCEHVQGNEESVHRVLEHRAARERGVSLELYRLLALLDSLHGLHVEWAISSATTDFPSPPNLFFTVRSLEWVDRLTRSLVLATRHTSLRWALEATHQSKLLFVLRPRLFHSAQVVDPQEVRAWTRDLVVLRDALWRDTRLPWWEIRSDS